MRVNVRQVIVTTSLVTHQAIDIPPDLRTAVARFAQVVH
jgi:4-hydroxybenzoyl-CoA thioesterase